jgi:4-hydroxy-tetrahydrodipicolinate synthase
MITGALVAIATPMRDDGSIDYDCYQKLIDWQVSEGADAIDGNFWRKPDGFL